MTQKASLDNLLKSIAASPTPYHAVTTASDRLCAAGFAPTDLRGDTASGPGRFLFRRSGYLVAWVAPDIGVDGSHPGFAVVGAHTDSPNLRIKAQPDYESAGWSQLGVSVYGGALTNSWLDRDLALAGRVMVAGAGNDKPETVDFMDPDPLLRVAQLAIHLDRSIREKGLKLDPQKHLDPLWGLSDGDGDGYSFGQYLADQVGAEPDRILNFDVMAYDTVAPRLVGRAQDLISSARLDNQLSCFAGVEALSAVDPDRLERVAVLVLYDHEEVGSMSDSGADSSVFAADLERISARLGFDRANHLASLAASNVVSADGAHATHPNYVDRHDAQHLIEANGGLVVKQNVNQRYATDPETEAWFRKVCADAGLELQTYVHRNDIPCGSTIGPISAGRLGIATVDCGVAQLAMHSIRELAGADDYGHLVAALGAVFVS